MTRRNIIYIESRRKNGGAGTGTETGYGTGTGSGTVAFDSKKTVFFFFLFYTLFLIQELARVTEMKRILTSRSAAERADAADLNRESVSPRADLRNINS